ncbi:zinc-binding alcohol dehydrogenase family protein [Lentzea flava]|uniref:alcohol dehydrogenase n=1 Tax=Lentzea flava TaxID=103732 RepID=A0ABQ2UXH3_9PSEU|nr:zinc-binding alcohol dehydrogenase family protein [Lentzea flava]MCP2202325.1 alcohol dehydrogenase, propanol-preferring [Lentzea flava]GGU58898.1 alcohol dehydrogenase [Lentzea flava]
MLSWQTTPLRLVDVPVPSPAPGELLVRVLACGVCRTDLHVVDGDLPVHRPSVVPGHQVVGEVVIAAGDFVVGERVGIAWLRHTCGSCRFCLRGDENLCPSSLYTGWDADGGYASYAVVPAAYALRLPAGYSNETLAPLLCAGIIGYRALKRACVPDGGRLGIYGFGGSAHLAAQVAVARGYEVHVVTRSAAARELALSLGAASASADVPPVPLDSAVLFAPAGTLVPAALEALERGGTLAIAGIHLSDVPGLSYSRHLFQERQVRSVTANTRADAHEFLSFCDSHRLSVAVRPYPLAEANLALSDLRSGRVTGAAVLVV